ncbi:MAG: HAD family hydrolase [Gorillibacterium sp.]|nr:HAD family hydrolase [Gorillibacterium sp.]
MEPFFSKGAKQVVFFDLNRTIIDPVRTFEAAFLEVFSDFAGRWDRDSSEFAQQALEAYQQEREKRKGTQNSEQGSERELRIACLQAAISKQSIGGKNHLAETLDGRIRERGERHPLLYADTRPALENIAKRYQIAIISNGRRDKLLGRLARTGLGTLIPQERLFSPGSDDRGKPHIDIYRRALIGMNVKPELAIMVGDSWKNDVKGALAVGMSAIWLRHGFAEAQPIIKSAGRWHVVTISSLTQLADGLP